MRTELRNVSKVYHFDGRADHHDVQALASLSLTIAEGELACIVGPSGCGKSTILNLVAGLERPTTGEVLFGDAPVAGPGPDRVLVFQAYTLFPWLTARENIEFGLRSLRLPADERRRRVDRELARVGLNGFARAYPHELSGGMQQRVAIARALTMEPRALLMDEPFAALDAQTRNLMQEDLLTALGREPKTMIFVTHSVDEALFLADTVTVLSARPARMLDHIRIDLPRPRKRTSRDLNELRERILAQLAEQVRLAERGNVPWGS
ncbi:MAG: ABC transporter ATP-binding protein [Chloroflexi bacterium]|nr:ABC transporter ATP-binding protein [Chloroflexota bacterium]